MKALLVPLALALLATSFVPTAAATGDVVCNDRDCLVSIETYVCVTEPCDGIVVCLAHGKVCSNRILP